MSTENLTLKEVIKKYPHLAELHLEEFLVDEKISEEKQMWYGVRKTIRKVWYPFTQPNMYTEMVQFFSFISVDIFTENSIFKKSRYLQAAILA